MFTQSAIKRIEELGGLAASVFHDRKGLLQVLRPSTSRVHPSLPQPLIMPPMNFKQRLEFSLWERRGYLHPVVREKLRKRDPTFEQRYLMVDPVQPLEKPDVNLRNIPGELRQEGIIPS